MPVEHYENFPVASFLLPKALRRPIEAIYHFARMADDIADEGNAPPDERLLGLAVLYALLTRMEEKLPAECLVIPDERDTLLQTLLSERHHPIPDFVPETPFSRHLTEEIAHYRLPLYLFRQLLDAFAQDVVKTRYQNAPELFDYCRRSANPVGRLVLHLLGTPTPLQCQQSDHICTALQIINFWQDVAIDGRKGRIYLPLDDLARFGVREEDIISTAYQPSENSLQKTPEWQALMSFQTLRASELMLQGTPLAKSLPGRLRWEIRMTVQGGLRILEHIKAANYDVFHHRPILGAWDWFLMVCRSITM